MSIPVIGTAVVNNTKWVKRLLESIDYPVDEFVIFNNNGRGELEKDLESISSRSYPFVKKIKVCHLPANIGCAGVWNMIIKCYMLSPYWLIVNDDVAFTPNFLEAMVKSANKSNVGMVHGTSGEFGLGYYDLFLIKDWVVQKIGLFDENFYPAYVEDCDYIMRILLDPFDKEFVNLPYLHGDSLEYKEGGSQTIKLDAMLKEKVDHARYMNENSYMNEKWGESWRWCDPSKTPFNKDFPITYTTYDLDFNRRKHLGF